MLDETVIYYFIHLTGRDLGNTGIQRVVRNLGRVLQERPGVNLVPVRWCAKQRAVVHVGPEYLDVIALFGGPRFELSEDANLPIREFETSRACLLIPEVPHLASYDERYPSVDLPTILGYARKHGLRCAAIFHDLLPLTHPDADRVDEQERLQFTVYGQALANFDIVLPVSMATRDNLLAWWRGIGFRAAQLPKVVALPLPEEMSAHPRVFPGGPGETGSFGPDTPVEFISIGTVFPRKNQLRAIDAFNEFCELYPETRATFTIVGLVTAQVAGALARRVARSRGRVRLLGYVSDEEIVNLITRSRATVFVSLAEGFGLPVAESLWLGTPCLCSCTGSVAEIAVGGGCLPVDPLDVGAIRNGFARLCYDETYYRGLLDQLRSRSLRTWHEYGHSVAIALGSEA